MPQQPTTKKSYIALVHGWERLGENRPLLTQRVVQTEDYWEAATVARSLWKATPGAAGYTVELNNK